jgi:hypothetical protein
MVVDEAAFIPDLESEWNNAMRPVLTDYKGSCLFISTPRGKNFLYALYMKGVNREKDFESFHFTSYDNPHLDSQEIDDAREQITEAAFKQEYLAEAGENMANPFGTDNITRNTITTLSTAPSVVYGIDVASMTDYTAIIGLDAEGKMSHLEHFRQPWEITKERIKDLPGDVPKYMDSTGVGQVVLQELQQTVQNLNGFVFTSTSKPQLIYSLIKDVEKGNVKFTDKVASEMMVYEYAYTSTGHIKFGAQSGFHDDMVSALALAAHFKGEAVRTASWQLYTC